MSRGITNALAAEMQAARLRVLCSVNQSVCGICADGLCEDHQRDCVWIFGPGSCYCETVS